jgi:hypothetical protein
VPVPFPREPNEIGTGTGSVATLNAVFTNDVTATVPVPFPRANEIGTGTGSVATLNVAFTNDVTATVPVPFPTPRTRN